MEKSNLYIPCIPHNYNGLVSSPTPFTPFLPLDQASLNPALFQHYFDTVSFSFSTCPTVLTIWREAVFTEACLHPPLWHAISAVSALHLLSLRHHFSQSDYYVALNHHHLSICALREAIKHPTPENCNALYLLSVFVNAFVLAFPQTTTTWNMLDDMDQLWGLMWGFKALNATVGAWLAQSSIRKLSQMQNAESDAIITPGAADAIARLHCVNEERTIRSRQRSLYSAAIYALERRFRALVSNVDNPGMALVWLAMVPREYIEAVQRRDPLALVIAAHFGVLLHESRGPWYIGDRGARLVRAVDEALEPGWKFAIEWPLATVAGDERAIATREAGDCGMGAL